MENERERAKKIAAELNLKQKAALLYGRDFWYLRGSTARADLPDILLTDGPHGVRKQDEKKDMLGIAAGEKATVYPTGAIAACSWDEELLFQEGQMLGAECREKGVNVLLGPAINHIRDPRGGRNFEYLSEDPLLSGLLAAAYVRGVQGKGVGACVKHFACNSQENYRMIMDGIIDERALQEIYLKPFEIAVKNARPFALMTAYNKINGEYCSQNETLMNAAREWGFDGVFLTDWGAMREMSASYRAGLDAEMPGTNGSAQDISAAVLRGEMSEEVVTARAERVLELLLKTARPKEKGRFCEKDGLSLAQKIAEQSAVLLKNEGALPLAEGEKIAVIGALAKFPRFQGAGSSRAEPYAVSDAYSVLKEAGVCFEYARGYGENGEDSEEETARAVLAASRAEKAVVFAGLNDSSESEGRDRADISLPPAQNRLIERISAANPNTVVVLQCGSPVAMPWIKNVNAVLFTGLAGCMGGAACADLLTGKANPCGKLAQTFPLRAEDSPAFPDYGRHEEYAEYRESIFTGYRGYDAAQKEVLFPFGHGLSYTKFVYESLRLSKTEYRGGKIEVFATIFNAGNRDGREIVQLYVGKKENSAVYRAEKELKGFYKLFLRAGERGEVGGADGGDGDLPDGGGDEAAERGARRNRVVRAGGDRRGEGERAGGVDLPAADGRGGVVRRLFPRAEGAGGGGGDEGFVQGVVVRDVNQIERGYVSNKIDVRRHLFLPGAADGGFRAADGRPVVRHIRGGGKREVGDSGGDGVRSVRDDGPGEHGGGLQCDEFAVGQAVRGLRVPRGSGRGALPGGGGEPAQPEAV